MYTIINVLWIRLHAHSYRTSREHTTSFVWFGRERLTASLGDLEHVLCVSGALSPVAVSLYGAGRTVSFSWRGPGGSETLHCYWQRWIHTEWTSNLVSCTWWTGGDQCTLRWAVCGLIIFCFYFLVYMYIFRYEGGTCNVLINISPLAAPILRQ